MPTASEARAMPDPALKQLSVEEATSVLLGYVRRAIGADAAISGVTYRDDYHVWECWVGNAQGYVKAYIVRLAASNGEWVCRHITVMEEPRLGRHRDDD